MSQKYIPLSKIPANKQGMCKCGCMIGFHFYSSDPVEYGLRARVEVGECYLAKEGKCNCQGYKFKLNKKRGKKK